MPSRRVLPFIRTALALRPRRIAYGFPQLRGDAFGGTIAGATMLPQAMAYGIVSGLGPVAGLYGTIAVCLFAGVFGGTRGMIGGPNMFVAVTMAIVVAEYADNLTEALTTAMLAGLIQLTFGVLRLGRYVSYVPYSVMSGFFTAIGLLIIVTQVMPALGAAPVGGGVIGNVRAWPSALTNANFHAVAVAGISLAVAVFWPRRWGRFVPSPFMALLLAALAATLLLRDAPVIGNIPFDFPGLQAPVLSASVVVRLLGPAFLIALLSSVSTLVIAMQIDAMTGTQHQPNREIVSHGLGNIAAGVVGGMPGGISGATMANVASGGRSQLAGVIAALILAVLMFGVRPVAEEIPYAAFSGILLSIGWGFMDRRFIARIHAIPRIYVVVTLLTIAVALFVGYMDAMLLGMVIAALLGARRSEGEELRQLVSVPLLDRAVLGDGGMADGDDPYMARTQLVMFPDRISVASARELARIVGRESSGQQVIVFDFGRTKYIDDTAAEMLGQMVNTAVAQSGKRFVVAGLHGETAETLNGMGLLSGVSEGNFAADLDGAKVIAGAMLSSE